MAVRAGVESSFTFFQLIEVNFFPTQWWNSTLEGIYKIFTFTCKIMKNFKDLICSVTFEYVCLFHYNKDCLIVRRKVKISLISFYAQLRFLTCDCTRLFGINFFFFSVGNKRFYIKSWHQYLQGVYQWHF